MQQCPDQAGFNICFDTGLDQRSFARTKMTQCLTEQGYIVSPDGTHEVWKPAGVSEIDGFMRVWGPLFPAKRLDLLVNDLEQQTALQAVVSWIKAKMFLGDVHSTLNPGAAFIHDDKVFFAPDQLSNRCLYYEENQDDRFNSPDLTGMDAVAFCAGVMLYQILTKTHPYPSKDIYQDMREGIFLPIHLASPDLNNKLSELIQSALFLAIQKKQKSNMPQSNNEKKSGLNILTGILELLQEFSVDTKALYIPIDAEKKAQIEKDKKAYLFKQNSITSTRRYFIRNKNAIIGFSAGFLLLLIIVLSMLRSVSMRPTTEGMAPDTVVFAYYDAFSNIDHMFMEACINGAIKSDVKAAATMFAITKVRQAYEYVSHSFLTPASVWLEQGGELPAPNVFGVTGLTVIQLSGSEAERQVVFSADYLLWLVNERFPIYRSDTLTLKPDRKNNWRITEIIRTEHY
ncbi:MAG: hypothetical protein LBC80_01245 [Treponema sp.]|jgi:hypothetical protein|nr:hypothetical protein [Treponema sp.]